MDYNPQGAMGGLFAPAFIVGNPQSEQAVSQWNAANLKTPPVSDFAPGSASTTAIMPGASAPSAPSRTMPLQDPYSGPQSRFTALGGVTDPMQQRAAIAASLATRRV
jgi:hypothetical protein